MLTMWLCDTDHDHHHHCVGVVLKTKYIIASTHTCVPMLITRINSVKVLDGQALAIRLYILL